MAADSITFQGEESIKVQITAPGKYMILTFEGEDDQEEATAELDLDDLSNAIMEINHQHEITVMIHQKTTQPSIISKTILKPLQLLL